MQINELHYFFQSILSKVKDSMRGMLSPSWFSDLVSNAKTDPPTTHEISAPAVSTTIPSNYYFFLMHYVLNVIISKFTIKTTSLVIL